MVTIPTPATTPELAADEVSLTIDGKLVIAKKGTLVVEAAKQVKTDIPVFCYHPKLKPVGACRMCLVQIEKAPGLQTACTTMVAQDMVVSTLTEPVREAQNGVIELLLANHPLDCPICDKGGECPLQDNTFAYGRGVSRFEEEKRHKEKALPLSDRIVLDRERCIMCYRCVRFHQEITGDESLAAVSRGGETEIGTLGGAPYDSNFSGNTIELCPVGALTSRQYRFKARPWDLVRTPSVCNGCAVGCNVEVHSRTEKVLRLVSRENPQVDDSWLCDRGRFDTLPSDWDVRPLKPLVRDGSELREATWDEAFARAGDLLRGTGAALFSSALSNEALWQAERLLPEGHAALWPPIGDSWPVEGAIANLPGCKKIVLVGLDAWNDLPVLALWIRKAHQAGAVVVSIGDQNGLFRDTTHWLKAEEHTELTVAQGLLDDASEVGKALAAIEGPAALLVHPSILRQGDRAVLDQLAQKIGANGTTGMIGAPALGANARGAQELAPRLAANAPHTLRAPGALLLVGDEPWAELDTGTARLIVATSGPVPNDPRFEVVLPLSHPYERQATITNLEGRIQHQLGGASAPPHARADWSVLAGLSKALDGSRSLGLGEIRTAIGQEKPDWARALQP